MFKPKFRFTHDEIRIIVMALVDTLAKHKRWGSLNSASIDTLEKYLKV